MFEKIKSKIDGAIKARNERGKAEENRKSINKKAKYKKSDINKWNKEVKQHEKDINSGKGMGSAYQVTTGRGKKKKTETHYGDVTKKEMKNRAKEHINNTLRDNEKARSNAKIDKKYAMKDPSKNIFQRVKSAMSIKMPKEMTEKKAKHQIKVMRRALALKRQANANGGNVYIGKGKYKGHMKNLKTGALTEAFSYLKQLYDIYVL